MKEERKRPWYRFKRKTRAETRNLKDINPGEAKGEKGKQVSPMITLGIISGLLIIAIIIPVVITSFRIVRMRPVDSNKPLVTFSTKKEHFSLNFKDIEAGVSDDLSDVKEKEKGLTSAVIRYLYRREQNYSQDAASLLNEVNRSLPFSQPPLPLPILPTIASVETLVKADLDDKKKEIERSFGIKNWPLEFARELQKEEYGNALSEEEAVNFKVDQRLKTTAFSSTQLEINSDFSPLYLSEIRLKGDFKYHSKDKERLVFKAGTTLKLDFLKDAIRTKDDTLTSSKLIALFSKSYNLKDKDKLVSFEDFLAKKQRFFWYLKLPIKLERSLGGFRFKVTNKDLISLLTLLPQSILFKDTNKPLFTNLLSLFELSFSLSNSRIDPDRTRDDKVSLSRAELIDLLLGTLAGGGGSGDTASQTENTSDSSEQKDSYKPVIERIKARKLGFESASTVELLTTYPETASFLLTKLFRPKVLTPTIFKQIVSDLFREFKIKLPDKVTYTLFELNQLNNMIKTKLLSLTQEEVEDKFNRVLNLRLASLVDGKRKLPTAFKIDSSYLIPGADSLLIFRPISYKDSDGILREQLTRYALKPRVEDIDLNSLFKEYSRRIAGEEGERLIISTLQDKDFRDEILKPADGKKLFNDSDIVSIIKLLKARLDNRQGERLTGLVEAITKGILKPEEVISNLDFVSKDGSLNFANVDSSLRTETKDNTSLIRLISLELRRILNGGQ